jgi:hypothetical protein
MGGAQSLAAPSVPLTAEVYPQCAPQRANLSQPDGQKQYVIWPCKSASRAGAAPTHTLQRSPENTCKRWWLRLRTNHTRASQTCRIKLRRRGVYMHSIALNGNNGEHLVVTARLFRSGEKRSLPFCRRAQREESVPTTTLCLRPLGTSGCLSTWILLTASKMPSIPQHTASETPPPWRIRASAVHAARLDSCSRCFRALHVLRVLLAKGLRRHRIVSYLGPGQQLGIYPLHLRRNKSSVWLTSFQILLALSRTDRGTDAVTCVTVQL